VDVVQTVSALAKRKKEKEEVTKMAKKGLYANIQAKRRRIKAGSGETMRKPGSAGAPKASDFRKAARTARNR